jgi:hypothetical protein
MSVFYLANGLYMWSTDIRGPQENIMPVNKTLYVRDEDVPIWDKAKELIGGESLSTYLTNHLRIIVGDRVAADKGMSRIVLAYRDLGKRPRIQAFQGRWLIPPDGEWSTRRTGDPDYYSVALTAKDQIVVFNYNQGDSDGRFAWGHLEIFPSFDIAIEARNIPHGLIAIAMERMGLEVEELDI